MIYKIKSEYEIILTYGPIFEISGEIFECFDYYLFLRSYFKVGILFFTYFAKDFLKISFESKYSVPWNSIISDIFFAVNENPNESLMVIFPKDSSVILVDGNLHSLKTYKIFLASKYIFCFRCNKENYFNSESQSNAIFLQDFRIYGRNKNFPSKHYIKKLPFKFYKKCKKIPESYGMFYVTYNCRYVTSKIILDYFQKSKCNSAILCVPFFKKEYENLPKIIQLNAPIKDFFEKFGTYIYLPIEREFDCSSRLLTECFLLGKKVFLDLPYSDLGLEIRYSDCKNNLESLNLKENDEIIEILKNKGI